ncbi:MAG: DJ-1/PfpI family protein [Planctomycetota bacterium]|jgi:4-methyl-5(b-hydroxyethyl)-thiazole monophosphate biosynthesis|nr:DJ-1/PfpI family protein [Planctomycetota bacterium]
MAANGNARAVVLLADGFEEIEAATPADVLRRAGIETIIAGVCGLEARGSRGLIYRADAILETLAGGFDLVVLPGGMPGAANIAASATARALAEKTLANGGRVAAICAAPAVALAAWGLLEGRRATCYPGMETMFPPGAAFVSDQVVEDGNLITSRGPGTALEFALRLASLLAGEETAERLARDMLFR